MAHLNLSRSVTIKKAASGVTEGVGRMGKCFIKDVSYQRPDIGRTFFFIHDNVLQISMRVRGLRDFITTRMTKAFFQAAHLKCGKKNRRLGAWGESQVSEVKVSGLWGRYRRGYRL